MRPVGSDRLAYQGPLQKTTSVLLPPRCMENAWNIYSTTWSSGNSSKNPDRRTGNRSETPPLSMIHHVGKRSKTTEWIIITWPISVISDHVNATIGTLWRVFWMYFNCARLLQSIPDTIGRGGRKPEVVFLRGSPCVQRVSWVDSDSLRLAQSNIGIPIWRQQTGSSYVVHNSSRRLDFSIDSDCPRFTLWISQNPGWAIIAEVTTIAHNSVIYWPISKRSIVSRSADGPLSYSKMAAS